MDNRIIITSNEFSSSSIVQSSVPASVPVGQLTERLSGLGLVTAAATLTQQTALAKRLEVAYEHYRFVTQEKIDKFNIALKNSTLKRGSLYGLETYKTLTFTRLKDYPAAPPAEVLDALEAAQALQVFDEFEIAQITERHVPRPDPILFGKVTGCADLFYIAQWANDVRIEDILQADEGFVR